METNIKPVIAYPTAKADFVVRVMEGTYGVMKGYFWQLCRTDSPDFTIRPDTYFNEDKDFAIRDAVQMAKTYAVWPKGQKAFTFNSGRY